jgi:glycosyltransferase involved in cell wall biosynthesis
MPTLFLDLTTTSQTSLKTGIERVAQTLFQECILLQTSSLRIVPVYLDFAQGGWQYRHARAYEAQVFGKSMTKSSDPTVQMSPGDTLLILDFSGKQFVQSADAGFFRHLQVQGVTIHALVYDLLPITFPYFFPPGASEHFTDWLSRIITLGSVIAISQTVAKELGTYLDYHLNDVLGKNKVCQIQWFHLGANFEDHLIENSLASYAPKLIQNIAVQPTFLCVGTIEPRKGYGQVLEAFSLLWDQGFEANLLIVGAEGWARLPSAQRLQIPELVCRLRAHPQLGKRLFWFDGINDTFLKRVYQSCICFLAASEGEGFGLPLIEAAHYDLPILARDIPIFREVLGEHAQYFSVQNHEELSKIISDWYVHYLKQKHVSSQGLRFNSWRESAQQLLRRI